MKTAFFASFRPTLHLIFCIFPPVSTFNYLHVFARLNIYIFASFKSYTRLRAILHNAGFYVRFSDQTLHT